MPDDAGGGEARGAVWIAFLAPDGSVRTQQKISEREGGLAGALTDWDCFGTSLAGPGDIDGDGVVDLLAGSSSGVWTLLLAKDGTVRAARKLENDPEGVADSASFGTALAVGRPGSAGEPIPLACGGWRTSKEDEYTVVWRFPERGDTVVWLLALDRSGELRAR